MKLYRVHYNDFGLAYLVAESLEDAIALFRKHHPESDYTIKSVSERFGKVYIQEDE